MRTIEHKGTTLCTIHPLEQTCSMMEMSSPNFAELADNPMSRCLLKCELEDLRKAKVIIYNTNKAAPWYLRILGYGSSYDYTKRNHRVLRKLGFKPLYTYEGNSGVVVTYIKRIK